MPFIGKKIVQNQVTGTDIVDGTLVAADIADGAVSTAKLAADAVDGTKLADNAVNSEHYTDGSIDTAHVADANITTAKLADNAVTTAKITDANITTAKIADTAITTAKITDANITTAKVADDAVTQAKIAADAVGTNELANDVAISTSGAISTSNNLTVRNSSTTGATINVGTTSTSVANGGYIGGILFDAGSSNTACARIQALSNGTDESGADFSFECRDSGQSFTEKMRITGDGNVGIGTDSPGTKLQIVNDTDTDYNISTATTNAVLNLKNNTSGTSNCVGMSFSTESNGEWFLTAVQESSTLCGLRFGARTGGSRYDRMDINSDGTVKIGLITQPAAWGLRVYNNSGHATIQARNFNGGNMVWQGLNLNGSQSSTISESGVGYFANGVSSDETLKNVKGVMNDGWSKLKDIQPKSFTWKKIDAEGNKSDDDLDGNIHYGVMAQDLKKIIPDLAYGEEGGMSVDYNGLLMVAINTIKELEARIKALEEA